LIIIHDLLEHAKKEGLQKEKEGLVRRENDCNACGVVEVDDGIKVQALMRGVGFGGQGRGITGVNL
jgi:predicted Zn-ribbon and HTH transcriptional regulator